MKVISVYSDNILPLYENFISSLRPHENGIQMCVKRLDLSDYSRFEFGADSWHEGIKRKIEFVIDVMRNNLKNEEYFVVSDVDIHFFNPGRIHDLVNDCYTHGFEFSGVLERPVWRDFDNYYNAGFISLKRCEKVIALYEEVLQSMTNRESHYADQDFLYESMHRLKITHGAISPTLGILGNRQLHAGAVFLHATHTRTCLEKMAKIEDYKRQMKELLLKPQ